MATIAELKAGQPGIMLVNPGLRALVVRVMDRRIGQGSSGRAWSMQAISLRDNTGEIQAVVWNRPDLAHLNGKEVHLSALNTQGKGWAGAMVEDRSYQAKDGSQKTARQIKCDGIFLLEEANIGSAAPPQEQSGQPAQQPVQPPAKPIRPSWAEYCAVARAAHLQAAELEPDVDAANGSMIDRSRARMSFVATCLIAYQNKAFTYEIVADDDDIPF
jgi:hypothetical protein